MFLFCAWPLVVLVTSALGLFTGHINWQFLSPVCFGLTGLCILSLLVNFLKHLVDWHCLSLHKLDLISVACFLNCKFIFHAWLHWIPPITTLGRWALLTLTHSYSVSWLCLSWQKTCCWCFLYFVTGFFNCSSL